jgi:MFS family permease|tara:strand:+ start:1429 stop:2670 length:1242 start_codon:yes stop_codon:yes gene_type:complete
MHESGVSCPNVNSKASYRKWGILVACFLASAVTVGGSQYSFGHFVEPLQETFGWSRTEIGLSLSLVALGSFISPLIGSLIDRHGARPIMTFCLIMFAISYLARPFMTHISHWYVLGIIQSFTIAGANILPTGKLIGLWFPKNRGKILGIAAMGNNFGGIAVQPAIALIISAYSWQMGYAAIGIFAILVSIYSFLMVRDPIASLAECGVTQELEVVGSTLSQAFRMRKFYVIIVAFMCGTFTYSALLPQVSSHLIDNGIDESTTALAVSLFAACGMLGKFIFGMMSDKFGPRPAMIFDLYGQSVFACLLVFAGTSVPLWLVVPFMGFFLGAFGALTQLLVIETFGVKHFGAIMGVISIGTAISLFSGPIIAGLSYDLSESYGPVFFITSAIFAIGGSSLFLAGKSNSTELSTAK